MGIIKGGGFDMDDGRQPYSTVCTFCVHSDGFSSGCCKAFPDGIPDVIWEGTNKHTKPFEGDHGIQFEKANPRTS